MSANRRIAGLTALVLAISMSLAVVAQAGAAGARTLPGLRTQGALASITLPSSATLEYTATVTDQDACTGDCVEWGYGSAWNWDSYSQTASATLSAHISLSSNPVYTNQLTGSGPLNESSASFQSTGTYVNTNCTSPPTSTVALQSTNPGSSSVTLGTTTGAGGAPDLALNWSAAQPYETVLVSFSDCEGSSSYTTTIQAAATDIYEVDQATGLGNGPISGWSINPNWTPEAGGTFATETASGSAKWPASTPPQADNGTMSATQTWTIVTTPCSASASVTAPSARQNQPTTAAASACGLEITSPAENAVIAVTDGQYLTPQPGPDERQPEERNLTVRGDAPSSDTSITLNGQQVPVQSGNWTAQVPVTFADLGQLTLTASDANFSTQATVTLFDLEISSPTEGMSLPITDKPAMPEMNATVSAVGYPGDTSHVTFSWTLLVRGQEKDRQGWHSYGIPITGDQTGTADPWNLPDGSPIVGGIGRLSVEASLPGVLHDPVQSEPRWINIPGTNPVPADVNTQVEQDDPASAETVEHIFCYESGGQGVSYPQFNSGANEGEPAIPVVPADWKPNPPAMQPSYGAPPAGIGIAQDDPATFPAQQWNWIDNVRRGIQVYNKGLSAAKALRRDEQDRLGDELDAAYELVKKTREKKHKDPISKPPLKEVPAEPAPYDGIDGVTADAITRYNTGSGWSLFRFNYQYYVSDDGLQIETTGDGRWAEQDGKWKDSGSIHEPDTWHMNPSWDKEYPKKVEACHPPQ
jgi:hypothetical protein